jgi:hypothetical protein
MAKPAVPEKMRIWDALGKTDPSHTKTFKRAGGFSGTAIKPMWANLRMTQEFGPCGVSWGQTEPNFTTINAEAEILVYCTVGLWYMDDGEKRGPVFGVGGDKVLTQIFEKDRQGNRVKDEATGRYKTYAQTDDEAFKKAYTDALSNAMKFIGVGADVHMGLFDDNKYVQSVRDEFNEQQKEVIAEVDRQKAASSTLAQVRKDTAAAAIPPELDWAYQRSSGVLICRILDAKKGKKKEGGNEFVTLQINNTLDEQKGKKPLIYYWHNTHRDLLLGAKGKIVKIVVSDKKGFFDVQEVLEVDGVKIETPVSAGIKDIESPETQARLLASTLDLSEEDLEMVVNKLSKGDWSVALEGLRAEKQRRDTLPPA